LFATLGYVRFLYIVYGSACELETQTMLFGDFGHVDKEWHLKLRAEIGDVEKMLNALNPWRTITWILESWNPWALSPN
jgi:four helix bundle protein